MRKILFIFLLSTICFSSYCQSIREFDSLLTVPGLYIITYPDDGPKEALKGLKPLFCKDIEAIKTFFQKLDLEEDTACEGKAYYNYIIKWKSDSVDLQKWMGLSFNRKDKSNYEIANLGNDRYYSFNPSALSYLNDHSVVIKKQTYTCAPLQKSREFYNFLQETPETYFISSIYDSAFTKYDGSVLLQFEFAETLTYNEGEKFIREQISRITSSNDYFYHLKEAHWHKPGFTTEKIVLHINEKNLLPDAIPYTIQSWSTYGPITFTVYSNRMKDIETHLSSSK